MERNYTENMSENVKKIVITGGPCAGKTTAMKHISRYFTDMGYNVLVMAETATELINSGIAPWTLETKRDYQRCQLKLQLAKEEVFFMAYEKLKNKNKTLIFYDRGIADSMAYMGHENYVNALSELNLHEQEIFERYDAVFHLVSAAKGAKDFYTLENNEARKESCADAAQLDEKFIEVWGKHPYFKVVDCCEGIDEKIKFLIEAIEKFVYKL